MKSSGAASSPATNATRHTASGSDGRSRPPRMPLTPAMRPLTSANITTATPMIAPPASARAGVNAVQSMAMMLRAIRVEGGLLKNRRNSTGPLGRATPRRGARCRRARGQAAGPFRPPCSRCRPERQDLALARRYAFTSTHAAPVTCCNCAGATGNTEKGVPPAAHTRSKRHRSSSSSSFTGAAWPMGATPPIA